MSGALFGIIAFILIAAAGKAFRSGGENGRYPRVEGQRQHPLGPRERVVIVEVEDARLVLGVTASSINVLHALPLRLPRWRLTPGPADFQSVMKSLLKRPGRS